MGAGRLAGRHPARHPLHPLRAAGLPRRARLHPHRHLLGSCAPDTVSASALRCAPARCAVSVDCPPVVQPWFGIPLFRLGAARTATPAHWNVDLTDGPDTDEFGDTAERLLRRRATSSAPAATTSGCAWAAPTAGRCPGARSRRGAVPGRADRRGRGACRRRTTGSAPRPRRHRGLPGARRGHQRGLSRLGQARPGDRSGSAHVTSRTRDRATTPPAGRTSPRSRDPRADRLHQPGNPTALSDSTSQIGTAIHRARPPPHRPQHSRSQHDHVHPPTAGVPNTPVTERPNLAKVVAAGCVGIFVELYDNGIFAFMATALAIVFFGVTSPSNASRSCSPVTPSRSSSGRSARSSAASSATGSGASARWSRHRADQRRHRGHRDAAHVRGDRHRRAHPAGPLRVAQGFSVGGEAACAMTFLAEHAPDGQARPDHQLRPDRVVRGPAHRHPGRLRHVAVAEPGRDRGRRTRGAFAWRIPFLLAIPHGHHRLLHPQANQDTPNFNRLKEEGGLSQEPAQGGVRHPRAPPRDAARPVHPADERLRLLRAVLLHADVPQEQQIGFSTAPPCWSPRPAWSPSRIAIPFMGTLSDRVGPQEGHRGRRDRHGRRGHSLLRPHRHRQRGPRRSSAPASWPSSSPATRRHPHPASSNCSPPGSANPPTAWATTSRRLSSAAPPPADDLAHPQIR